MIERHSIKPLVSQELIKKHIGAVAWKIDSWYREEGATKVILLGALTGAFIFMSELIQELERINATFQPVARIQWLVDFVDVGSYAPNGQGTMSSVGEVLLRRDSKLRLAGEHVLIVEDIADTCHSLDWLFKHVRARGCYDCQATVMLRKPCAQVDVPIRFPALDIPNEFVVGMGLDWKGLYRGLPFIGAVTLET